MQEVHHHASVVIIESKSGGKFLFGGYDDGYPVQVFRGAINLIGGNHNTTDKSPFDIFRREISEELIVGADSSKYAPGCLIDNIRDDILSNAQLFGDYVVTDPPVRPGRKITDVIYSVYNTRVNDMFLDDAAVNLQQGKRLTTEGFLRVVKRQDILSGKIPAAWGTPPLMREYFKEDVPNPHNVKIVKIGMPRGSFEAYESQFKYEVPVSK